MQDQSRILLILKYLYENTDSEHQVSTRDIKKMLVERGIPEPVSRTIDSDIELLIAAGHDVQRTHVNGKPACYHIGERDLDTVELKVLIDAVAASRFINIEKSKQIISHLASMASPIARPHLESELEHVQSIKHAVGRTLYNADTIFRAIVAKKKVQFVLYEYTAPAKELKPHRGGKIYVVSPYATIWANDRYYLVAHEEDRNIIITPRMDHIRKARVLDEDILPPPDGFDIGYYYSSAYKMYGGPEMDVTLECENDLIGHFIERGLDFECVPVSDHSFQATVKACVGSTFFGWLVQYGGRIVLKGPDGAVSLYREHLDKVLRGQGI